MAKSYLPIVAGVAGMYLLMRSGKGSIKSGLGNAERTAEGLVRKVKSAVVHGDILGKYHPFAPEHPGDTIKVTNVPEGSEFWQEQMGHVDAVPPEHQLVDVYHDTAGNAVYVTAKVPGTEFGELSGSGLDTGTRVMTNHPESGDDYELVHVVRPS